MDILLATPRGFCAGVDRAIDVVERALTLFGAPIYVRHQVVHNRFVVEGLRKKGALFVEEVESVPNGATLIFSAHGVSKRVRHSAESRGLRIFDATCPLVTKVHMEVARHAIAGREVVLIGHQGHPEVIGTLGQYQTQSDQGGIYLVETVAEAERLEVNNPNNLAFVTQTTLSMDDATEVVDALRRHFPAISGPRKDDICYATQNRQDAVKVLARECRLILVVGSPNSSNSNRLREIAEKSGTTAWLIDGAEEIQRAWLEGVEMVGVTAGASAPEVLVGEVIERLKTYGANRVLQAAGEEERVVFSLPKGLQ